MENNPVKTHQKTILNIVGIWLFLRFLTSLAAAAFSNLKPLTPIEQQIALWPPSQNFLVWLNRVFVAPWLRYDAVWFEQILSHGYKSGDGSTSFHPLYIWLSFPLHWLGVDAPLSLLVTSSLATLVFLGVFYKFARLDHEPGTAWIALLLLLTFPVAFILFAPYTESLFMLWAVAALYSIRRERWALAALFSFLAALTRQQGIFLALPLAWGIWETSGRSVRGAMKVRHFWLYSLAAPAGLSVWTIYRLYYMREGSLDFSSTQGFIYSAFISPSAYKVIADQSFRWPWDAFIEAFSKAVHSMDMNNFTNLGLGIGFLIMFIASWKYLRIADRLYSFVIILISFSTISDHFIYESLPRHLLLAFPVFIGLSAALRKLRNKQLLLGVQMLDMIFLIYCYILNGWIP
jgi:Gpi18-like mannosyltransferase